MRLFFAVELPHDVQAALGRLKPKDEENRDYRWVEPSLLHVTLVFLGEQPHDKLPALEAVGAAAASTGRRAVLRLGEAGSFGSRKAPRVLWIGLDGDVPALQELQARLDAGLRQAGLVQEEGSAFRPHITLARRRESARGGAPPGWPPSRSADRPEFPMQALTLFESRLSPHGPSYRALRHFPLGIPDAR